MNDGDSIEKELREGRSVMVNTKGVSMRPLLWQGKTQVRIEPLKGPLKVGDMPLVRLRPGLSRLHRLIRMEENYLVTRGDNCRYAEKAALEDVLGVVTAIYRGNRQIRMDGRLYRLYVSAWQWTAPIRLPVYALRDRVRGWKHHVRSIWKKTR